MRTVRSFANEGGEAQSYQSKLLLTFQLNRKQALAFGCYMWASEVSHRLSPLDWSQSASPAELRCFSRSLK